MCLEEIEGFHSDWNISWCPEMTEQEVKKEEEFKYSLSILYFKYIIFYILIHINYYNIYIIILTLF